MQEAACPGGCPLRGTSLIGRRALSSGDSPSQAPRDNKKGSKTGSWLGRKSR
jgi:hypothetical protein